MNVNINLPGLDKLFAAIARRYELKTDKKFPTRPNPGLDMASVPIKKGC